MIKISGLGTDFGKYAIFAISDDFQHLASIEHIRIPKRY